MKPRKKYQKKIADLISDSDGYYYIYLNTYNSKKMMSYMHFNTNAHNVKKNIRIPSIKEIVNQWNDLTMVVFFKLL